MSDIDVIIRVHTQGVQEIGNLSASLRGLSTSLRNINVPMSKLDTSSRAVYKALGVTSRGVDNHAKSIKELVRNQRVLGAETKNITRDLNSLRNAYALAGRESTSLGRSIGASANQLSGFSRTFRGMRLRAFGSDLSSISLRMTKLGKDAQFVGRSLMINLTLPLATFARVGLRSFLAIEKQQVRLVKVMENLASTADIAREKILGLGSTEALTPEQEVRAKAMVKAFKDMDDALTALSLKFGVSKELTTSLAADFAELGITSEENVKSITKLTLEIEKLGSMDVGPAQDLSQALFFQSKRAFEVTGAFRRLTTARQREEKAIKSSITQMYLFNAIENATALTLEDLGDSFSEISAMATSYGLSMTEAAALLAPMKAAGLDIGASANSIKVSLQRLLAPTKQNTQELQKLAERFGVAGDAQNEFAMSTKTGLVGLGAVVKMFDKVRKSSQGSEGALRLMSDLFEKRQGPRMYLAIEQLADFNNELARVGDEFANLNVETAEARLVRAAESAAGAFTNFNTTVVPKTIRSFQDIGKVARIATAFEGQIIEFEPGVETKITAQDIANAKAMRKAVADTVLEAKRLEGVDIISEVKTESGRALMIQLAGATNAADVAQQELARSLATAGVSIESLKTTFKMFAADIVSGLMPTIKSLSERVQQMYNTWNSEDFAQTRQNIIRLITVVGGILGILGPITLAIGTLQSVIGKFGLVISRFIPKLKNVDGEFTRLGQSAQFAKKQINGVYEAFVQASGMRAIGNAFAASRPTGLASTVGAPQLPQAVTPAVRDRLLDKQKRDAMRAAGVSRRDQMRAAREYAAGASVPATGAASRSRVPGSRGRTLPAQVVEAMRIIQARDIADATPTTTGLLRDSRGRMVSPTSGSARLRSTMLAPVERQQAIFDRSQFFRKKGIETDRMGTRFVRRGRLITEGQADDLALGGLRGVRGQAGILRDRLTSGIRAIPSRPGIAAARAAAARAPSTGAGAVMGAAAGIKASTVAMAQNMSSVKGAKDAMAALNAQYGAFGEKPGTIKKMSTAMLGFVKNLKLATLAGRIFKMTLMFSGVGAIIAVVAGIIYLVVQNLDKIKGSAKVMEPLKRAFTAVKDAVFMMIRPIQDLFAMFGSGGDEGAKAGDAIVKAFEGIAAAVEFVAGLFKVFVEKVIQPYLYGIVNIVMAVVSMFKGNWGDAFNFLLAGVGSIVKGVINLFVGLGTGIVTVLAKAITVVLDLFGKIPYIGGVFRLASKGINALADGYKKVATGVANFATGQLDKIIDKGVKKSKNAIQKNKPDIVDTAEDIGEDAGEAISNAYGNADMESASEKIKKKIKEGLADKAQELYDYVVERFSSSISKFVTESVKALNKQKEAALKVFDIQINTLVKLEKAEESLTRAKEYETNRRKLIDDAALRQQNYVRDRALAIYEGRVDDARILDQEERVASRDSNAEIATLDQGRRKDLAKENLESLKDAIKDAQEVAGRFFDESIEKFQEAAAHITRIAPVTQEQYAAQLEELRLKTVEYSDKNNLEFGVMFEKFATTITDRMPNTVDQFGQALGMFTTPFDELVALAKEKYGLGSENDNTVLGVTKGMSDAVIGITLGMVTGIGDTFTTQGPTVIEELKTAFINPFKKALDEAEPTKVFNEAIIDGNEEILNSFRKILALNPDLMDKISKSLDPAIKKYLALQAAAEAAADAMNNAGGAPPGDYTDVYAGMDAETQRFARIKEGIDASIRTSLMSQGDSYSRRLAQSGNFQRIYEDRNTELLTNLPIQIRNRANANPVNREVGGPIPKGGVLGADGAGVTGFLNAPTTQGIPAILHGGEFVVNAEAVKRVGLGALAKINDSRVPKFKKGGFVGAPDRVERMALARKKEKAMNFATASVGNFKRAVERAEAPVKDTRSFKQKTFDVVKGLGMVAKNAAGGAISQFSKIGAQDGLIDKLTRFDKSSVDLIAGGIGRSGKILKGAYSNVLLPIAESLNATFVNPAINTGGRLIGKNPNLRQAGMVESAMNIADVVSTVFTLGASKVATTTGRVTLTAVLKEMAKGSVKTSDEMLAQKLVTMGMSGKFPTMASQLTPSNFGIDAASFRPKAPIKMLGEAMNNAPAASVQDAMLPVTRRSADSIAYVRDADPLDLMGNTPFTPPVIKPPLVARGFSEQMEVFRALGRLAGTKNAPLRPYQQTLIEEYTDSFNKLLTLRALDLSGNKVGLEAYVARVGKLYGADGSFGHPIKPNSGIPLMERMEASGLFSGSLRFADVLDNPEIQQMIDVLMRDTNQAMRAGSVVYPENIETYRGLSLLAPVDDPRKYLDHLYRPGYTLPGQYVSTSVNEEVAKSFSSGPLLKSTNPYSSTYETIPILEHITIPKGNEVFSPSYYGLGLQNEREIIIPPAYRLRIDDILEPDAGGNGYFRVQATAVKAAAMAGLGGVGIVGASMIPTPSQAQAMTADTMERVQNQKIAYYESVRRLNDFIASQETKNASDPYNAIHSRMEPVADLTSMTIRQAIDFATQFKLSNTKSSGAIGKYQNIPEYLGDRARLAGLTLDSLYDEKTQELIAQSFLLKSLGGNGIGLENYLSGRKSQKYMIDRIANIYRGMPGSDGRFVGGGSNKEGSDLNMLGNLKNYLTAAKSFYMPGFKEGGFVGGMPSTAIPAMLHGGEYVINAKAVQQLGLPYLNAMNQISQSQFRPPSSRVNAPTGAVTNNVSTVNIQVENFVGEEAWFESMMEEYNINVLPKNQKLAGLEKRRFSTYNGINQGL